MTKEEIHVVSKDKEAAQQAISAIEAVLEKKGLESGPGYLNSQSVGAFRSVVKHGNEPDDKTDNWMRAVFPSTLNLVDEKPGQTIYHAHVEYQPYPGVDGRSIVEKADLPDSVVIQYQTRDVSGDYRRASRGKAPFSYDPAQDYYTEPENY